MKFSYLAGAAIAVMGAATANAADVLPPPEAPIIQAPIVEPVAAASGWYLRGDVGYTWSDIHGPAFFQGSNANYVPFTTADLRSSYSVGGGVGYQATRHLRFDVTADYFAKAKFRGSTTGSCGVAASCVSTDISSMTAYSLMANAYVDIATWGRVTPYVGAGVGATHVSWKGLSNTSCDATDPTNCDPTEFHDGYKSWRLTYALMAGASIDVTCNVKADVGYRFRHVDGGRMFGYSNGSGPGYDWGYNSHEVRGGLRYQFGGCEETVYVEPPVYPQPVYK